MAPVFKRIEFHSRVITFTGTVRFASMGKYVTDFLRQFKSPGWRITDLSEEEADR